MNERAKIIEVMARASIDRQYAGMRLPSPGILAILMEEESASMEAALTAYESHLQASGMAVVPRDIVENVVRTWRWNYDEDYQARAAYDSSAQALEEALAASPDGKAERPSASAGETP
jgi:hypothetical protein